LFCSISDPDDDVDKTIEVINKIATRFWKKHQSDISIFRTTSQKSRFQTIIADIENICQGGKITEIFPKLMVVKKVLEKIMSMGMINEEDFQVAIRCTGDASPLRIARMLAKPRNDVNIVLKKLEELDIVGF
jgi:ribosomal protein S20